MRFYEYLLVVLLAVIMGGWLIQTQIGEPLVRLVDQTGETITESGRRRP